MSDVLTAEQRQRATIESVRLVVGLEIHVELATRRKMFSRAPSPAHPDFDAAEPNTLIDPVVLALPGTLPVMNRRAIEMAMMVGVALGCEIARESVWDRKGYFYPDLPKAYQISQYDLPICFDGSVDIPVLDDKGRVNPELGTKRIGIIRAHLEEDAGKLLHEAPGGLPIDHTIVDLNRAGTPLLEIVTSPDFGSADEVVTFCRMLRNICRFLGVSECVMQKGHIRFEPNINCVLTLEGGRTVTTPIVEIKNLNSFRAVRDSIEYEFKHQADRWREDGRVMGPGAKTTRGWNEARAATVVQREKEDAHDYRYFPDPDLPRVVVDDAWLGRVKDSIPELPMSRLRRFVEDLGISVPDATLLVDERDDCVMFERAVDVAAGLGVMRDAAGRAVANLILQSGLKRANERASEGEAVLVSGLGISAEQVGAVAAMRVQDRINAANADRLFGILCEDGYAGRNAEAVAEYEGMLIVRDDAALDAWCREVMDANPAVVEQVRSGKMQAAGRLIGEVMKKSGGNADAKAVRARLLELIGVEG